MTDEALRQALSVDEDGVASVHLQVPLVEQLIRFELIVDPAGPSPRALDAVRDVLDLDASDRRVVQQHLWQAAKAQCQGVDWGVSPALGLSPYAANLRDLGLPYDPDSPCDGTQAYDRSKLRQVTIHDDADTLTDYGRSPAPTHRYAVLTFELPENIDQLDVIVRNGAVVGRYWTHDQVFLPWFESGAKLDPETSDSPLLTRQLPPDSLSSLDPPPF